VNIRFVKSRWLSAGKDQRPEFPPRCGQWQLATALHAVFLHVLAIAGQRLYSAMLETIRGFWAPNTHPAGV